MNKKLRRLLRRRQSVSNTSGSAQKTTRKSTLTSLLSERPQAEPNQYFRSNNQLQNEKDLKEEDEKSYNKAFLIVEDVGFPLAEKQSSKLEVNLELMEDDSNSSSAPSRLNFADNESALSGLDFSTKHKNSAITQSCDLLNTVVQTANNSFQRTARSDNIRNSFDPSLPATVLDKCRNSSSCSNNTRNSDRLVAEETNVKFQKRNDKNKRHNNATISNCKNSVNQKENHRRADVQPSLVKKDIDSNQECEPIRWGVSNGCKTVLTCNRQPSLSSTSHDNNNHDRASLLGFSNRSPIPLDSFEGDKPFPSIDVRFSRSFEQFASPASASKQTCSTCPQCRNNEALLRNQCWRKCVNDVACVATNHSVKAPFVRSPDTRHSHHHAFQASCSFANKATEKCYPSFHHCCTPPCRENSPSRSSPFISVSISGEAQARIIELPFADRDLASKSHVTCTPESIFQACRRHLEAHPHCFCAKDCKLHCASDNMAPSLVFIPNMQGFNMSASQTHCPCCYRIIAEKNHCHQGEISINSRSIHPALHHYSNIETNKTENSKSFGHFEISPTSYAKLLTFIESKRAALRKQPNVNRFDGRRSSDIPENLIHGDELQFLTRKSHVPVHNEYSSFNEQASSSKAYLNQTVGEMVLLAGVLETVEECPWYWGEVSNIQAKAILQGSPVGTFLLRDSSDSRYLFSVSVMTSRGPTSIRIVYSNGSFRFDSDGEESRGSRRCSPLSESSEIPGHRRCVIRMILHYTKHLLQSKANQSTNQGSQNELEASSAPCDDSGSANSNSSGANKSSERGQFMCSWVGRSGKKVMPVQIEQPQPMKFLTLQKLTRACISKQIKLWKNLDKVQELPLPSSLQAYLKKYPYPI